MMKFDSVRVAIFGMAFTGAALLINGTLYVSGVNVENQLFYVLLQAIAFCLFLLIYIKGREIRELQKKVTK